MRIRKKNCYKGDICSVCGVYNVTSNGRNPDGTQKYRSVCHSCYKTPYTRFKKSKCELCGFIPLHRCQLDVDHIDGSKKNSSLDNLMTLCANCHRLKTFINRDMVKN